MHGAPPSQRLLHALQPKLGMQGFFILTGFGKLYGNHPYEHCQKGNIEADITNGDIPPQ